ncbi:MAG TPA: GspH/FimT family pseudopilin [Casimicrobiaceae bacterium]|nr:GspH/FimT family pseudopilin [Casimicrobiaceae bacterium]
MGSVRTSRAGFTLVEMLVVLVVLGIVAGLGVALVAPGERDLQAREARRFAGALEYAAARAQWRNESLGVSAGHGSVRYWRRDDAGDRWLPVADDDVLATQVLAPPLDAAAVAYAGRMVTPDAIVPLRASGRNEPLAFAIETPRFRTLVALDPLNRAAITGPLALEP